MNLLHALALVSLSITPAVSLPAVSNALEERAIPPFSCSKSGFFPECCKVFAAGAGENPTGEGSLCTYGGPGGPGCPENTTPTCCSILVSRLILIKTKALLLFPCLCPPLFSILMQRSRKEWRGKEKRRTCSSSAFNEVAIDWLSKRSLPMSTGLRHGPVADRQLNLSVSTFGRVSSNFFQSM